MGQVKCHDYSSEAVAESGSLIVSGGSPNLTGRDSALSDSWDAKGVVWRLLIAPAPEDQGGIEGISAANEAERLRMQAFSSTFGEFLFYVDGYRRIAYITA